MNWSNSSEKISQPQQMELEHFEPDDREEPSSLNLKDQHIQKVNGDEFSEGNPVNQFYSHEELPQNHYHLSSEITKNIGEEQEDVVIEEQETVDEIHQVIEQLQGIPVEDIEEIPENQFNDVTIYTGDEKIYITEDVVHSEDEIIKEDTMEDTLQTITEQTEETVVVQPKEIPQVEDTIIQSEVIPQQTEDIIIHSEERGEIVEQPEVREEISQQTAEILDQTEMTEEQVEERLREYERQFFDETLHQIERAPSLIDIPLQELPPLITKAEEVTLVESSSIPQVISQESIP